MPRKPLNATGFFSDGYRIVPILCYHQFTNGPAKQQLEVSAADFRAQLQYLRDNNFTVLSMAQVEAILNDKLPMPERAVVLTIDDGYRSVYDVAFPIIQEFNYPFTLYVYTDFVGGGAAMTWQQLTEVQRSGLIDVQSHTKTHTSLSRLSTDETNSQYLARIQTELAASREVLQKKLGHSVWQISYPYGNSSDQVTKLLKDNGYRVGLTVTRGFNTPYTEPALLHRTMIYNHHTLKDFSDLVSVYNRKRLK